MCDKNFYLSMDEKQIHDDDSEDEDNDNDGNGDNHCELIILRCFFSKEP